MDVRLALQQAAVRLEPRLVAFRGVGQQMVERYLDDLGDLVLVDLEPVRMRDDPHRGPDEVVRSSKDRFQRSDDVHVLGGDAHLLVRLAEGTSEHVRVARFVLAAGEGDLALVHAYELRPHVEDDVPLAVVEVQRDEDGGRPRPVRVGRRGRLA